MYEAAYKKRFENARKLNTEQNSNEANLVLRSVLGQLSDGIWENNARLRNYGCLARIVKEEADAPSVLEISNQCYSNPWAGMSDVEVLDFLIKKIKQVIENEHKYYPEVVWDKDCTVFSSFLDVPVCKAYEVRKGLMALKKKKGENKKI